MGERLLCKQEVIGSIPFTSTKSRKRDLVPPTAGHCLRQYPRVAAGRGEALKQTTQCRKRQVR